MELNLTESWSWSYFIHKMILFSDNCIRFTDKFNSNACKSMSFPGISSLYSYGMLFSLTNECKDPRNEIWRITKRKKIVSFSKLSHPQQKTIKSGVLCRSFSVMHFPSHARERKEVKIYCPCKFDVQEKEMGERQ